MSLEDRIKQAIEQLDAKIEALKLIKGTGLCLKYEETLDIAKYLKEVLVEFLDGTEVINDFKDGKGFLSCLSEELTSGFETISYHEAECDELIEIRDAIMQPLFNFLIDKGARF